MSHSASPTILVSACRVLAATALCAFSLSTLAASTGASDIQIRESGSTLIYPLFTTWITAYAHAHDGVHITAAATGSEAGVSQVIANQVEIGTSDAYLSDVQVKQNPQLIDVPLAIAAQTVNYNVPGLNSVHLKLDGPTLAAIYTGTVRQWDAAEIAALNPGVKLPHQAIFPIHRAEGSGDTFIFTQFLTFSTPSWENDKGYGTTMAWPAVAGSIAATGNKGMLETIAATPYSIGYVGISFSDDVAQAKLGTAALKSSAGEFVLPNIGTITTGAASLGPRTPADERLSLVFAPAHNAYPLVNYEYAVVSSHQPNENLARELRRFLSWAIVPSETKAKLLDTVHFIPLPPHTWELSQFQIQSIH
jgi:phosphate transport system substrate-binding protein